MSTASLAPEHLAPSRQDWLDTVVFLLDDVETPADVLEITADAIAADVILRDAVLLTMVGEPWRVERWVALIGKLRDHSTPQHEHVFITIAGILQWSLYRPRAARALAAEALRRHDGYTLAELLVQSLEFGISYDRFHSMMERIPMDPERMAEPGGIRSATRRASIARP